MTSCNAGIAKSSAGTLPYEVISTVILDGKSQTTVITPDEEDQSGKLGWREI